MGLPSSLCLPHWGMQLLGLSVLVLMFASPTTAQSDNETEVPDSIFAICQDGLLIPRWNPQTGLSAGDRVARAILYGVIMIWLFIGVAIVSDKFMSAIEMITSEEKEVKIKKANG